MIANLLAELDTLPDRYVDPKLSLLDRMNRVNALTTLCEEGQELMNKMNADEVQLPDLVISGELKTNFFTVLLDVHVFGVDGGGCEVCG